MQEMWVRSLGREDPMEKDMATQSRILAWEIPWTEEPGGPQSMRLQRVGYHWVHTHTHTHTHTTLKWRESQMKTGVTLPQDRELSEVRRETWSRFCLEPSAGAWVCDPGDLGLLSPELLYFVVYTTYFVILSCGSRKLIQLVSELLSIC